MRSDGELVEAWGRGDRAAAEELVERYYRSVFRFFDLRVGHAAEDLTQRTFLGCVESRARLQQAHSFRAFLFSIARNLLFNHLRSRTVESNLFETGDVGATPDLGPTASRIVARHEEQVLLLRAMQALDVDTQLLLVLFYWEALKAVEISVVIGAPVSTITTRLSRARKALHDKILALPAVDAHRSSLLHDIDAWFQSLPALEIDAPRLGQGR
jgi:RNA polymerase sigma factor (sigma-70 family)